jgi:thioesterase domain-containing protein/acyl carrier protein
MVPSAYVQMQELPLTPNGKLDRKRLPRPEISVSANRVEPRDATEMRLKSLWEEILGIRDIGITDNFFDLGGHSLTAVSVSARMGSLYGTRFSVRTIFERPTIWELAEYLRQNDVQTEPSSIVPLQPNGSKPPFFCVHPAGGMAHCYMPLAHYLGPDQPVYGFQARGLEGQQPPITSIEEMAATYIKDMKEVRPKGPYHLGGWSLGAVVAYEMAQQLTASGEEVQALVLLDGRPNFTPRDAPWTEEELHQSEQLHVDLVLANMGVPKEQAEAMSYEEQLNRCMKVQEDEAALPLYISLDQFRRFLRVQATNEAVVKRYRIQPYTRNLVLFRSEMAEHSEEAFGWERLAAGGVEIHSFPEQHVKFVAEPNVRLVAEKLAAFLSNEPALKQIPAQAGI